MEGNEDVQFKEFHLVLITLACETWTLSCLSQETPLPPNNLQETLELTDLFEARLKKISNFLLAEWSTLGSDNGPPQQFEGATTLQYSLASTALAEIFHLFTPVYALCSAFNDYNGTVGANRLKVLATIPSDTVIYATLHSVAAECESQVLDIMSCFDASKKRILASYPHFSHQGFPRDPSVPDSRQGLTRNSFFTAGGAQFGTDRDRIVTAQHWNWYVQDPGFQLRVPHMSTLQFRDVSKLSLSSPEFFISKLHISRNLEVLIGILVHLAFYQRRKSTFTEIFVDTSTSEDNTAAGMLLLRDQARVSIRYGRIKARSIFLFQNCLVFGRAKFPGQVIVRRVSLSDLLQVRYRSEHPSKGSGILTIYWREKQSSSQAGQEVFGAQVFFDDLSVLKIWAAFLAINTSTRDAIGDFPMRPLQPSIEDVYFIPRITRLRDVLCLVPAIESGALNPYNSDSVLHHLST
ncbi:hypothetical protein L207DRAFT_637294 [Hyaloscypha variabilis F]|uniref:Uncharacterized protein n=1 Tax=Hyaloscypha variabilis (strain UAMH 11265 / GT02V1 / F) TaxID=1149755 RepID=A0A2J6RC94_HYAVF|nr:hypothetical protein L207DRAFT_637294 [Hyaloscypha variabilis F]